MPEIPSCLNRRYKALDNLIRELDTNSQNTVEPPSDSNNVGIRLMCDFWNILKDDPDCNLTQEVQQCLGLNSPKTESVCNVFGMRRYMTYRGCCDDKGNDRNKPSCHKPHTRPTAPAPIASGIPSPGSCCRAAQEIPLSKVLCNLKEAASFDQKCHVRVRELMKVQNELQQQIQVLEERERAGIELLKEADNMWLSMEGAYKKKVSDSLERQKDLLKELKDVEASANKWRKNERDLEFQIKNMIKVKMDIVETKNQKMNDIKVMDTEISNFEKRIENNNNDIETTRQSLHSKRYASDKRLASIATEIAKVQKRTQQEIARRRQKEEEGAQYVMDARDDLQKICKVLLQKKIEHEDLRAEKNAILEELLLLNETADNCKEKCKNKEKSMQDELKHLAGEIRDYKVKCIKCHVCTDTNDVRKLCTDCPRCVEERDCKYGDETCAVDPTLDCVCMGVKQKFLDNIFDNMYTVLERKSKSRPGKAVAEAVLNCLKRSTNGKLNAETRQILQEFVLSTVKKNLNLTIVGGAVKTRCEMDPETYKQLMLCLNRVDVPKTVKEDKGTTKRDPCPRWEHSAECHCPQGPKDCVCLKKAPPPPSDPAPCPQDEEDAGEKVICPHHKGKECGPDCGMQGKPGPGVDPAEIASWRPDPCSGPSCSYSKETPTQFLTGSPVTPHRNRSSDRTDAKPASAKTPIKSDPLSPRGRASAKATSPMQPHNKVSTQQSPMNIRSPTDTAASPRGKSGSAHDSDKVVMDSTASCKCSGVAKRACSCVGDRRRLPRQQIIEEVLGRFNDFPPIAKVARSGGSKISRDNSRHQNSDYPARYNMSEKKSRSCGCPSDYKPSHHRSPCIEKTRKKRNISKNYKSGNCKYSMRCGNMTLFAGINNISIYKDITVQRTKNKDIKELLCPKFVKTPDSLTESSAVDTSTNLLCSENDRLKCARSLNENQGMNTDNVTCIEKNVCNTVKEIMKNLIVNPEELRRSKKSPSDTEWITLEKLFQRVISLTNVANMDSSDTVNEVEMRCEVLELSMQK